MKNFSGIRFIHVDVVKYNPGIWKPQFHCSHFFSSLSTGKNRQIFKPGSSAFFGDCFIRVLIWFLQRINQRKERMRRGWRWEGERVERRDFMKKGGGRRLVLSRFKRGQFSYYSSSYNVCRLYTVLEYKQVVERDRSPNYDIKRG